MEARPPTDLRPIDDPEVDVKALQARVAAQAERLRGPSEADPAHVRAPSVAGPHRSPVEGSAAIRPYADLHGGVVSAWVKRAVRRALRWLLWPVTGAMTRHNRAVSSVLAENARQLARLEMEGERLQRDLDMDEARGRESAR